MIALLCPTKARPEKVWTAINSFLATRTRSTLTLIVDDNDRSYDGMDLPEHVSMMSAPTRGPAAALNHAVTTIKARVYGMIPDDGKIETPGWEAYVERAFDSFKGRIGVLSPAHLHGSYMQFPFVSREWIDVLGWFANPGSYHFCWDTMLEMLGDASQIAYPGKDEFYISHESVLPPHNYGEKFNDDCNRFLVWAVTERRELVQKLREAIARA